MKAQVKIAVVNGIATMSSLLHEDNVRAIEAAGREIAKSHTEGGTVFVFGNGGSASQAEHMVGELMGYLRKESRDRPAIRAMALTAPSATVTCVANDLAFSEVFSRQLTCARPGDFYIGLSTSARSENVLAPFVDPRPAGVKALLISGHGGDTVSVLRQRLERFDDTIAVIIDSDDTPRIQEATLMALHLIAEAAEEALKESACRS